MVNPTSSARRSRDHVCAEEDRRESPGSPCRRPTRPARAVSLMLLVTIVRLLVTRSHDRIARERCRQATRRDGLRRSSDSSITKPQPDVLNDGHGDPGDSRPVLPRRQRDSRLAFALPWRSPSAPTRSIYVASPIVLYLEPRATRRRVDGRDGTRWRLRPPHAEPEADCAPTAGLLTRARLLVSRGIATPEAATPFLEHARPSSAGRHCCSATWAPPARASGPPCGAANASPSTATTMLTHQW